MRVLAGRKPTVSIAFRLAQQSRERLALALAGLLDRLRAADLALRWQPRAAPASGTDRQARLVHDCYSRPGRCA